MRKKSFLLLIILFILFIGVSMVSAANNTSTSDINNDTSISSTSHAMVSTSQINNTVKETKNIKSNIENTDKTLKNDATIESWDQLKTSVKSNGTYTLNKNLRANSTLTTSVNRNVTINGNGYTISFTKDGQISVTKESILKIENIILDGNNTNRQSSGIYNDGTLSITNSTIENFNIQTEGSTEAFSGAIHNNGENCLFNNNNFTDNNVTENGGAIYNNGENCLFTNNTFTDNNAVFGGAIYSEGNNCTFKNNIFTANTAVTGGAIYNLDDTNSLYTNNNFTNNKATGNGGAIYEYSGVNSTFKSNTFTNNIASNGGAIYSFNDKNCSYTINIFKANKATLYVPEKISKLGGAIHNNNGKNCSYITNTFTANTAENGGAIYNEGNNCTFKNNIFTSNIADYGGAIDNSGVKCSYTGNIFIKNIATEASGAIDNTCKNCSFINNVFTNNTSKELGGAITNEESSNCKYDGNTFTTNKAVTGGAIYNLADTNSLYTNNNFTANKAVTGGAITNEESSSCKYDGNTFTSNIASKNGGAILNNGKSTIINNKFTSNKETVFDMEADYGGGAIYNNATLKCNNNIFIENTAKAIGGAIYNFNDSTLICNGNEFIENTAKSSGGAIDNSGNLTCVNNKFTLNKAISLNGFSSGGAISNNANKITITKNTFTENKAVQGAAISDYGLNIKITNNNFTNNIASNGETLNIRKPATITKNNYFNNTIQFNTKKITRKVDGQNIIITANIKLKNPSNYDADILKKTTYTLYLKGQKQNIMYTQVGNSTFNIQVSANTYQVYETLNIAQSIKNNYKTNTIKIEIKKSANIKILGNLKNMKSGDKITLTALITENKILVNSGKTIFKINGKTLCDAKGNAIKVNIKNGIAQLVYTLPTGMSSKDYIITAVYAGDTYNRVETKTTLHIVKTNTHIIAKYTIKTNKTSQLNIRVYDENNKVLNGTTKITVKINGKTTYNQIKITNGKKIFNINPSKYNKIQSITIISGESNAYNTSNITIKPWKT